MIPKNDRPAQPSIQPICPYLGILEDPQTCLSYPSRWNVCHLSKPAVQVQLRDQAGLCLTPAYVRCLNFQVHQQVSSNE